MGAPLTRKLAAFDFFRQVPKDISEATGIGGSVSLAACAFLIFLVLSEFWAFITVQTKTSMFIESPESHHHLQEQMKINYDFVMHEVPCALLSVDVQDIMGSHLVDVGGFKSKTRLGANGQPKGLSFVEPTDLAEALKEKGEGCHARGHMLVNRVPGNFHVSAHTHADQLHHFFGNQLMNVSHTINHLSFGEREDSSTKAEFSASVAPLDAHQVVTSVEDQQIARHGHGHSHGGGNSNTQPVTVSYEYYVKVVPTQFQPIFGKLRRAFQFTASFNTVKGSYRIPAIYFRYDFSPVTVKFTKWRESFAHFIVQLFAIIGGCMTTFGLLSGVLQKSVNAVKKARQNKLG